MFSPWTVDALVIACNSLFVAFVGSVAHPGFGTNLHGTILGILGVCITGNVVLLEKTVAYYIDPTTVQPAALSQTMGAAHSGYESQCSTLH